MSNIVELTIATPSGETVTEATSMLEAARAIRIRTPEQSVDAQQTRQKINARIKGLMEQRLEMTRPLDAAKRTITEFFAHPIEALTNAMHMCDAEILSYARQVEEARVIAQRRADEAVRKERERLQEISDRAAAAGQESKSERFAERAVTTVAQVVLPPPVKVAGVSLQKRWTFRIVNAAKVKPEFMTPDEVKIGKVVRSMGADARPVVGEGVEVFETTSVASRGA